MLVYNPNFTFLGSQISKSNLVHVYRDVKWVKLPNLVYGLTSQKTELGRPNPLIVVDYSGMTQSFGLC